jgi:hypothetical protein
MSEPEKKKTPLWALILIGVAVLGFVAFIGIGVMAALGVYGTRKFIANAKGAEARNATTQLALGLVMCSADQKELPPTTAPVPATLAEVAGRKYLSTTSDWAAPAFACAHFSMAMPQYYRYQWVRTKPTEGDVLAEGDLDGDGKIDDAVSVHVSCVPSAAGLTCTNGIPTITVGKPAGP